MISVVGSANISSTSMALRVPPASSSRILEIPCKVCGDNSSGKHYNIYACDGCAGFFKRSIRKNRQYVCKAKASGTCVVDKTHRNQCRACRLLKCQEVGMNKDAVQHERGPRNSTLRRQQQQMVQLLNETGPKLMGSPPASVLDLAMSASAPPPRFQPPLSLGANAAFFGTPTAAIPRMPLGYMPTSLVLTEIQDPKEICEAAARLLLFNVTWAKTVGAFSTLPLSDQLLLLEDSWRELFILAAAQYLPPLDLTPLLHAHSSMKDDEERLTALTTEVREFQSIVSKIVLLRVDPHEFACMRAMVLFKSSLENLEGGAAASSDERVLRDPLRVAAAQENTQLMLNKYVLTAYPGQPLRFGKLLLLLPALRSVSGSTIEELFFRSTIGNIPIVRIFSSMYKSDHPSTVLT